MQLTCGIATDGIMEYTTEKHVIEVNIEYASEDISFLQKEAVRRDAHNTPAFCHPL